MEKQGQGIGLSLIGYGSLALYLAFCIFYNIDAFSGPRLNREIFTWLGAIGLGLMYWKGFKAIQQQNTTSIKTVLYFAVAFGVLAFLTPNFHSTDLFGYINRGWQQWHYGTNPYVTVVNELPNWLQDPLLTNHWVKNPSPYGFLYIFIAKWLCAFGEWVSPGQKQATVMVFKALNLLIFYATGWLIYQGLRHRELEAREAEEGKDTSRGQDALEGLYLFLWNPLLLIHTIMNGHNDILMGSGMALTAYFALTGNVENKRWVWILPAITAALLIKYAALVMLPFAIVFLWRQKAFTELVTGTVLSIALFFGVGFQYLQDWQSFKLDKITHNAQISHSSLHAFFFHLYKNTASLVPSLKPYKEQVKSVLKAILTGIYGILMLRWGINSLGVLPAWQWKSIPISAPQTAFSREQFIAYSCYAVGFLVYLITFKFYPWYLAMVFPMAMLLPGKHWFKRLSVWLTISHLLSITFVGQAHVLNYLLMVIAPAALFLWKHRTSTATAD